MQIRATDIRTPRRILAHHITQSFKLPLADVFKLHTIWPRCRCTVEIHRNTIPPPNKEPRLPRQNSAVGQRSTAYRNERNDVGSTDPGMHATLLGKIDQLGRSTGSTNRRLNDRFRRTCDGNNRAIVSGVERPVEQTYLLDLHSRNNTHDFAFIRALREIWDTFDNGFRIHRSTSTTCSRLRIVRSHSHLGSYRQVMRWRYELHSLRSRSSDAGE